MTIGTTGTTDQAPSLFDGYRYEIKEGLSGWCWYVLRGDKCLDSHQHGKSRESAIADAEACIARLESRDRARAAKK